jgi:hypothetical protein
MIHERKLGSTDYGFLPWLISDFNSVLGLLHRVVTGDVTDVSKTHAASIFRICSEDGGRMCLRNAGNTPKIARCNNLRTELTSSYVAGYERASRFWFQCVVSILRVRIMFHV